MHVACVSYFYDAELAEPAALLDRYRTLTGWAEGLAQAGATVSVVHRFKWDAQIRRNGVVYAFVQDPARRFGSLLDRAPRLHRAVASRLPDVVHVNGLNFARQAWWLKQTLGPGKPVLLQDHANRPPTRAVQRLTIRFAMRRMDGVSFAARTLARPWLAGGYLGRQTSIFELMEGSSAFRLDQRAAARKLSGLSGQPLCLWVGRLIPGKDPLTVLDGFALARRALPAAHLALAYTDAPLLPAVEAWLAANPDAARHVTLLGQRPHAELEAIYNSADFFLLGSHTEGSGYAALEALSCGVVPILTDIPTFRVLTDDGRLGGLWPVGDAEALARTLTEWHGRLEAGTPRRVRALFDERFSYAAIGRQALAAYQQLLDRARR